jgi:hypothetical protein
MPANMRQKGIKFSAIAQDAIDWYENHDRKDVRIFKSRMKTILDAFSHRIADDIKPSDIDTWLGAHAGASIRQVVAAAPEFPRASRDANRTADQQEQEGSRAGVSYRQSFMSAAPKALDPCA